MSSDAPAQDLGEAASPEGGAQACALAGDEAWEASLRAWAEPQLRLLGRLAESAVRQAEDIERRTLAAPEDTPAEALKDFSTAHARVGRGARVAIFLQSRVIEQVHRLRREIARDAAAARAGAGVYDPEAEVRRKRHVKNIVWRVASDKYEDDETCGAVAREAVDRLDQDDIYGHVCSRPMSELIAEICADLGLVPDWPALSREAWARDEIASGNPGAPLKRVQAQDLPPPGGVPREAGGGGPARTADPPPSSASRPLPPEGEDLEGPRPHPS